VVVRGLEEENGVVGLISDPISPVQKWFWKISRVFSP